MNDQSVLDSRYSWTRLAITLLIATIGNVGMWSIIVIMPHVQAEFGVARADASLPYMFTMIGFALGNLLIGRAVDRYGITRAISGAALLTGLGFALAGLATSIWILSLMQIIIGFGTAACFGPLIADISHWFLRRRGIAVAIAASGNYISGAFWPMALSGVLTNYGWHWVYFFLAAITLTAMIPLALLLRRPLPQSASQTAEAAVRSRSLPFSPRTLQILLMIAGIGCCVAMSMPQVHLVTYSVDLGYGAVAGAQMLSLMLLGGVVSRLISGMIADKLGGVRTLLIGSCLQCLALFLYLPFDSLISLYGVSLVFGLAQGGIVPSYAIIVREYLPAREAGTRIGIVIMSTILGMALGGWLSGWIYDVTGSYEAAFLNGIAWNLMNITIMVMLLTKTRLGKAVAV